MSNGFFQAEVDPNAQAALEEANSGGNGKFPPLLKGEYPAHIVPLSKDASKQRVEVVDFGGTGPNGKKKVLRVAVKLDDGIPLGAGRVFFIRVPLFTRYAPNEKNPQGAPARMYFDFWGKALGIPNDALTSGNLGVGPDFVLGKALNVVLSEPTPPDNFNPLGSNEVSFVNAAAPVNSPQRAPGSSLAPWLDADDNLLPEFAGGAVPQQQGGVVPPAGGSAWGGVTQQDVAAAQQQAAAAQATPGGVPAGAWAQAPSY